MSADSNSSLSVQASSLKRHSVALFGTACLLAALAGSPIRAAQDATPDIHSAVRSNDLVTVKEVLTADPGAVNTTIGNGITPLHLAAAADLSEIAETLILFGADVDARTSGGFTPLHWAASRAADSVIRVLLAAGADVDAKTPVGVTPLHWAAGKNNLETIKLLLRGGADSSASTADGMTPLHWAVLNKGEETAELLAFKQVSDEMDNEPPPTAQTNAAPAVARLPADADLPSPPAVAIPATLQIATNAPFGQVLMVDIGFGERLSFVWIAPLRMWVGKYEITNGEFRRFRPAHDSGTRERFSLANSRQPVVRVTWNEASAFAAWIQSTYAGSLPEAMLVRLPTSQEWIAFASCGTQRLYPWGNEWPPRYGNFSDLAARRELTEWTGIRGYDDGFPVTCPVEQSGSSEWGLYGVGGNVWEWSNTPSEFYRGCMNRHGGSWDFDREPSLRIAAAGFDRPEVTSDAVGFRLVVAPNR
jgi:hypothetical protein